MVHLGEYGAIAPGDLKRRVGCLSQIASARSVMFTDGRAAGVRAIEMATGSGLGFCVLVDRTLDIHSANYRGLPLAWESGVGVVGPGYFEPNGDGWLRSWGGGLLTTCGLEQVGAACVDQGQALGLHGRIGNLPAEDVRVDRQWEGDDFVIRVAGRVVQSSSLSESYLLMREIQVIAGQPVIRIHDVVENPGFTRQPLQLLYHMNIGFPVVDNGSRVLFPSCGIRPRDEASAAGLAEWQRLSGPVHGFEAQVFQHDMQADAAGLVTAAVVNDRLAGGRGVYVRYRIDELPVFSQWKMLGEGSYLMGMEPGICGVEGRDKARASGALRFIGPGEQREFHLEIGVVDGREAIAGLEAALP